MDQVTLMQLISAIRWANEVNIQVDVVAYQMDDAEIWVVQAWYEGIESGQAVISNIKEFVDLMNSIPNSTDIHAELRFHGEW